MLTGYFERRPALAILANRDYRLLILGTVLVNIVMPFHFLTQVFWVQDHYASRSVLYVSIIGFV